MLWVQIFRGNEAFMHKYIILIFIAVSLGGCQIHRSVVGLDGTVITGEDYDTVLRAAPVRVKPLGVTRTFDAIEFGDEDIELFDKKVVFEIQDVLLGEYVTTKRGGPSKMEQAKEAGLEKDFMKVLTMDFKDPEEMVDKRWISVAVKDPTERFGISNWNQPNREPMKLYLKRTKTNEDTFFLMGVVRE